MVHLYKEYFNLVFLGPILFHQATVTVEVVLICFFLSSWYKPSYSISFYLLRVLPFISFNMILVYSYYIYNYDLQEGQNFPLGSALQTWFELTAYLQVSFFCFMHIDISVLLVLKDLGKLSRNSISKLNKRRKTMTVFNKALFKDVDLAMKLGGFATVYIFKLLAYPGKLLMTIIIENSDFIHPGLVGALFYSLLYAYYKYQKWSRRRGK